MSIEFPMTLAISLSWKNGFARPPSYHTGGSGVMDVSAGPTGNILQGGEHCLRRNNRRFPRTLAPHSTGMSSYELRNTVKYSPSCVYA
jgi:hypothetical protein